MFLNYYYFFVEELNKLNESEIWYKNNLLTLYQFLFFPHIFSQIFWESNIAKKHFIK